MSPMFHPALIFLMIINASSALPSLSQRSTPATSSSSIFQLAPSLITNETARSPFILPLSNPTGSNATTATAIVMTQCFQGPSSIHTPISTQDFHSASQKIISVNNPTIPQRWDLGESNAHIVRWYSNQCGIYLGAMVPKEYWIAPVDVAHVANVIADECLMEETGFLGGSASATTAADGGRFWVIVGGHLLSHEM